MIRGPLVGEQFYADSSCQDQGTTLGCEGGGIGHLLRSARRSRASDPEGLDRGQPEGALFGSQAS